MKLAGLGVLLALAVALAGASPAAGDTSQVIAAGTSDTNLPTETVWPGAQSPPYVCCWNQQGQYVTFAFTTVAGSTNLALRYSAGSGVGYRKLELDGAVWVAKQTFPATANWSTWATVTLNTTLTAGAHTLKVWFDSTAGSASYINLDNLTVTSVTPPPPPVVNVALGYADGAAGLTPWSGSPTTLFIGEPAQCCLTHGPDNGASGYDAGAVEITNGGTSSFTLGAVTLDFGGGSSPSHFDLWGGGTAGKLPQTVAPGGHVVLTMTSGFNFDTSDLFGEACHLNSGVVPVVHVTVNGATTDYLDDGQILNGYGADLASCPGDVSEQVPFTTVVPGVQPAAAPVNVVAPAIKGVAIQSRVMSGFAGGWSASPPPSLSLQWLGCDPSGANCAPITGATGATYRPTGNDVGTTLRLQVTGANASGTAIVASSPSSVVQSGPAVAQLGDTSSGSTSVFFTSSSTEQGSIFTAVENGTTSDFEVFARGAGATQTFTPRVYSVTNGQKGSLLATGTTVTVPKGTDGQWYVSSLAGLVLSANTPYYLALSPTPAVFNGTYVGAETSGQLSVFLDYTASAAGPPASSGAPAITGTPQQGQTLTASTGSWLGNPTSYAYQWEDCDAAGAGCVAIGQATSSTYAVMGTDVGDTIRVTVTATNSAGSTPATSAQTAVVQAAPAPPGNTALPTITGTAQQGQTLTASTGSWSGNPTSYGYQWEDCDSSGGGCTAIAQATGSTYALVSSDVGDTVRVIVTATNDAGSTPATSSQTSIVQPAPAPPGNTSLPAITGAAQQGQSLSASTGSWSGSPSTYAYQWQDCDTSGGGCSAIGQATASSYTLASTDVGHTIRVTVTATNGAGSTPATSAQTAVVQAAPAPPSNTAPPAISGTARQNQILTASTGSWSGSPTSFAYQWSSCNSTGGSCVAVTGATTSTLRLNGGTVGHMIRVTVTARNPGGSTSATSAATAVVQKQK